MNQGITSYTIGIDAGTTSIKGVLISCYGDLVASATQEYTLETGPDEICEVDPEIYWKVTCEIIQNIIHKSGINPTLISGIAFSSQGETIIVVDSGGKPLRKAIIWLDNRSVKEADQIKKKFGDQAIMNITGQPEVVPIWPATRILWLKENEPQIFNKAHKYLLVEDYLIFHMTGKYCTEHSLVSSTLYFDISQKKWWKEMLDFLGISEKQLPDLFPSGVSIGNLTAESALATGLSTKTLCVTGAYDHPAGAIGSGNINNGDVTLTIGASMAMCVAINKPVSDLSIKLPCQCHAIDGLYFLFPYGQTAGMVLKWFKDEFCQEEINKAGKNNQDPYDLIIKQAEKILPGAEGLIMLPHLMGTGSPEFNPKVKGVFAGIKLGMNKGHFIRSIIESVSLMIFNNLETMRKKGIYIRSIHVLGGASKSNLWNQILADVTGLPLVTLLNTENSAIGAGLLAGVGAGIFKDIKTACDTSVKTQSRFEPDMLNHELYNKVYKKYLYLYESLENFW
jgi:sugar (pentulose or hexulose) kinase